jgi:DNA-binding HxlR family transcriptional regulator
MSLNPAKPTVSEPQNQFVAMVKECIDSKYALLVFQKFSSGQATLAEILDGIPDSDIAEIKNILGQITQYTLVTENTMPECSYSLTASGKEFLAILSDIERLKLRYQN